MLTRDEANPHRARRRDGRGVRYAVWTGLRARAHAVAATPWRWPDATLAQPSCAAPWGVVDAVDEAASPWNGRGGVDRLRRLWTRRAAARGGGTEVRRGVVPTGRRGRDFGPWWQRWEARVRAPQPRRGGAAVVRGHRWLASTLAQASAGASAVDASWAALRRTRRDALAATTPRRRDGSPWGVADDAFATAAELWWRGTRVVGGQWHRDTIDALVAEDEQWRHDKRIDRRLKPLTPTVLRYGARLYPWVRRRGWPAPWQRPVVARRVAPRPYGWHGDEVRRDVYPAATPWRIAAAATERRIAEAHAGQGVTRGGVALAAGTLAAREAAARAAPTATRGWKRKAVGAHKRRREEAQRLRARQRRPT